MKITPLAADSLGARSMATLVETPDVTILLDPSVRLGPYRYDLPPHPTERSRQKDLWQVIRGAAKKADVLTVSHYHYDHHNPAAPSIFRGKLAFLKDGKFHINRSQRERSSAFVRKLKSYPKKIQAADGNQMDFGETELLFSPAVPHGYNDELGYVVMTRIAQGHEVFVHTSDGTEPENHKWRRSLGGMRWRRSTTAPSMARRPATRRSASSTCVRLAMSGGTRSSKRNPLPRRRRPTPWRPLPPPDHGRSRFDRIVTDGGWDPGDTRGSPPRDRVPGLSRRHQAVSAGHLSVPRAGPRLVRGTAGPADDESVRRVPSECVRRLVGIPEGPRRPPGSSRPGRGHVDPRRLRIVALIRTFGDPAVPAHTRPRESAAACRGSPGAGLDPLHRSRSRDGLEANRHGDVVHEEAVPREPVLGPSAAERPQCGHCKGRPDLEPVGAAPSRRPRFGHGPPGGRGRHRPVRPRDLPEPDHARLLRRPARDEGTAEARAHGMVDHRRGRHPRKGAPRRSPVFPVDLRVRGDERERPREQRRDPHVSPGVHVRRARGVEPRSESDAGPRPRVRRRPDDLSRPDCGGVSCDPPAGP